MGKTKNKPPRYAYAAPSDEKIFRVEVPPIQGEFSPMRWQMYNVECVELSNFFRLATYPDRAVKLPNGIITYDLKKYINDQLQMLRFHFKCRHEDIFLYTYDLLNSIKELPVWT